VWRASPLVLCHSAAMSNFVDEIHAYAHHTQVHDSDRFSKYMTMCSTHGYMLGLASSATVCYCSPAPEAERGARMHKVRYGFACHVELSGKCKVKRIMKRATVEPSRADRQGQRGSDAFRMKVRANPYQAYLDVSLEAQQCAVEIQATICSDWMRGSWCLSQHRTRFVRIHAGTPLR
jgi:hypothetical protein